MRILASRTSRFWIAFFALGSWHRRLALLGDKAMKLDVIQP
jgi:hypothetical protein